MKKEIKKNRIKKYFIDACHQIISTEGTSAVTIRKVADLAGYNSATLYNYFENLDHLMLYASCKYLKGYLVKLKTVELPDNSIDRYFMVWKLFSEEAFINAEFYYTMFFKFYYSNFNDAMKDYFELYPEELDGMSDSLLPMLVESKLWKRDYENLKDCVADDYIKEDDVLVINDMLVLIFQSLIIQASQVENIDIKAQVVKMLDYVERIFNAHRMDEK